MFSRCKSPRAFCIANKMENMCPLMHTYKSLSFSKFFLLCWSLWFDLRKLIWEIEYAIQILLHYFSVLFKLTPAKMKYHLASPGSPVTLSTLPFCTTHLKNIISKSGVVCLRNFLPVFFSGIKNSYEDIMVAGMCSGSICYTCRIGTFQFCLPDIRKKI